jgi:hypothetical protein
MVLDWDFLKSITYRLDVIMIDKYNTVFYIYLKDINSIFYFIIILLPTY